MCNNCSLCLERFAENDTIRTRCNHQFHKKCFYELTITNKYFCCPLCRTNFEEEWFRNLKNELLEIAGIYNMQRFEENWKWWEDFFKDNRDENGNRIFFEFQEPEDNEDWMEFLQLPENTEVAEGYNPGRALRVGVNPELVVWEGEIEDLFEEAERMQQENLQEDENENN